jgi:iron complex transport system ATP-binding protein
MNPIETAVSIRNVSFRYAPRDPRVLDRVSIDIPRGAVAALLGPNGSGKSTLLHLILGLLPPEEGEISLLGQSRLHLSRRETSRIIGLVPQDEHVPFDLSVLEYTLLGRAPFLSFLGTPGAADRRASRQALVSTGIAHLEYRSVPSLSGGERQLATVARALAQEPEILLLDEPTSHLDLANARRILKVLHSLKESGKTIVLTTHDPNAAAAVADWVILLREGRIAASGPAHTVLASEPLSATYGINVEVMTVRNRPLVLTHTFTD